MRTINRAMALQVKDRDKVMEPHRVYGKAEELGRPVEVTIPADVAHRKLVAMDTESGAFDSSHGGEGAPAGGAATRAVDPEREMWRQWA